MQAVGIILLLISIGTTVGPVGAVVVMNMDDLSGLVIPPEVQSMIDGDSTIFAVNVSGEDGSETSELGPMGFVMPTFVSATVDAPTRTFSVTVNVTNFLNYDLTLNTINATVQITETQTQLGAIHLSNPVTVEAGKFSLVTVSGAWAQAAEDYYFSHPDATSINVTLTNAVIDINGITVQTSQPIEIGEIPLSLEGL